MRAAHHVPQDDHSVAGLRVSYPARYRGQNLVLKGTVVYKIYDRNYGQDFYRVRPDRLEEYGNLTHYECSIRKSDITIIEVQA